MKILVIVSSLKGLMATTLKWRMKRGVTLFRPGAIAVTNWISWGSCPNEIYNCNWYRAEYSLVEILCFACGQKKRSCFRWGCNALNSPIHLDMWKLTSRHYIFYYTWFQVPVEWSCLYPSNHTNSHDPCTDEGVRSVAERLNDINVEEMLGGTR